MARGVALSLIVLAVASTVNCAVVEEFTFESSNDGFKCEVAKGVAATCVFADPTSSYNSAGGVGVTVKSPPPENENDVVLVSGGFDLESGEMYTITFWCVDMRVVICVGGWRESVRLRRELSGCSGLRAAIALARGDRAARFLSRLTSC